MCVTCGCASTNTVTFSRPPGPATDAAPSEDLSEHTHTLPDGTVITHAHPHPPNGDRPDTHPTLAADTPDGTDGTDGNSAAAPPPHRQGLRAIAFENAGDSSAAHPVHSHGTTVTLEQQILGKNDRIAAENRTWLRDRAITALNLMSSPGAGKTTLLVRTLTDLMGERPLAVIEGDQATSHDGERIAATGCPTLQVNTGQGCHLEAAMVQRGLQELNPPPHSLLLIENVGNLVCPALFDLGEQAKVAMLSITEGEDKPIKYPHLFRACQVMVLTKLDLLPYIPFDVDRCLAYAHQVNPDLRIFQVSALSGQGLDAWYHWLRHESCGA